MRLEARTMPLQPIFRRVPDPFTKPKTGAPATESQPTAPTPRPPCLDIGWSLRSLRSKQRKVPPETQFVQPALSGQTVDNLSSLP